MAEAGRVSWRGEPVGSGFARERAVGGKMQLIGETSNGRVCDSMHHGPGRRVLSGKHGGGIESRAGQEQHCPLAFDRPRQAQRHGGGQPEAGWWQQQTGLAHERLARCKKAFIGWAEVGQRVGTADWIGEAWR
jgi:hypothetical protein